MSKPIAGQGGAFEIGAGGDVKRIEGTQDAPAPLPPTAVRVDPAPRVNPAKPPRALAAVKPSESDAKPNAGKPDGND